MSVPTTQRASVVPKAGSKSEIVSRPVPSIDSNEVLIKITATAINPIDWKLLGDYSMMLPEWPAILGSDAAGEVVSTGADVKDFTVGDRVFFQGKIGDYDLSTFQQYAKMPATLVTKTPKNITDEEAAGVALTTVAVVTGYYDESGQGLTPPWAKGGENVGKGKAVVVLGGSSSVGQYAIQFARLSGFEKIITNSSASHVDFLKSLGATTVLDRSKATAEDFKKAAGGLDVGFVYDSISLPETQRLGVDILRQFKGGNVITVLFANDSAVEYGRQDSEKIVNIKNVMGIGHSPALKHLVEPLWKVLGGEQGYIGTGKYVPNRPEVVAGGLEAVEEALARNRKGVSGVKIVVRPNED